MALTGNEPISAANLKAVVDSILSRQEALAVTCATVLAYPKATSSGSVYALGLREISSNGITVSITLTGQNNCVKFSFPTSGVYEVTVDDRIAIYLDRNDSNYVGGSTFVWNSETQGSLTLGTQDMYQNMPSDATGYITVKRIA